jgi:YNFM family putative membrane transporter
VAYGLAGWPATVGFMVLLLALAAVVAVPLRR